MKTISMCWLMILLASAMQAGVYADSTSVEIRSTNTTINNLASEESEGLRLTVKLDEAALKTSGKLSLDITCKNLLDCRVYLSRCNPPVEYRICLTGPDGKLLGERRSFPRISAIRGGIIEPGTERKSTWDLNMLLTISDPGLYTLYAYRYVPRLDGNGTTKLISNQISFELNPDDVMANKKYWATKLQNDSSLRFREMFWGAIETEKIDASKPADKK